MVFAVIYELRDSSHDYSKFYEKIKSFGGWMHYIESAWIISPTDRMITPTMIFEALNPLLNKQKDYLLVIEVKKNYQGWLPPEAWDWMNKKAFQPEPPKLYPFIGQGGMGQKTQS